MSAIERGNANPTPVDINNPKVLVALALAARASEAGADILDQHIGKGIAYGRALNGSAT
jgi:hypothetical protein